MSVLGGGLKLELKSRHAPDTIYIIYYIKVGTISTQIPKKKKD